MNLYNMLRIGGRVVCVARFSHRKAEQFEADLHQTFSTLRFKQTKGRRYFKALCQALYLCLVYYGMTEYDMNAEQARIAQIGSLAMFFVLFWAEVKIGISTNVETRLKYINDDLKSGYTEWFRVPWPLLPFIIIASWFQVRPAQASIGLAAASFFVFWVIKYL